MKIYSFSRPIEQNNEAFGLGNFKSLNFWICFLYYMKSQIASNLLSLFQHWLGICLQKFKVCIEVDS